MVKTLDFKKTKLILSDFDGVFTDNKVYVFEDGREAVRCDRSDLTGLKEIKKLGVDFLVISKEKNPVVQARCKKLGIGCYQGIDNKKTLLLKIAKNKKLKPSEICYIGNDVNDEECLSTVGIGIAVQDSYFTTKKIADYVTKRNGGDGAIREVLELVIRSRMNG